MPTAEARLSAPGPSVPPRLSASRCRGSVQGNRSGLRSPQRSRRPDSVTTSSAKRAWVALLAHPDMGDMGFADLFETFFQGFGGRGSAGGRPRRRGPQQDDLRYDLTIDFDQAVFGQERRSRFRILKPVTSAVVRRPGSGLDDLRHLRRRRPGGRATRTPFGNFTQVAECPTCGGTGQVIADPCSSCSGRCVRFARTADQHPRWRGHRNAPAGQW